LSVGPFFQYFEFEFSDWLKTPEVETDNGSLEKMLDDRDDGFIVSAEYSTRTGKWEYHYALSKVTK
jgi:hypothetical protein